MNDSVCSGRSRFVHSLFLSRETELLRYDSGRTEMETFAYSSKRKKYPGIAHNGLFSRSLKRRKILRLLSRALGEAENLLPEMSRREWCLDKFSTKRYTDATVLKRTNSETRWCWRKKKITAFYSISRGERRAASLGGVYRRATLKRRARSENVCFTHKHRLSPITLMAFLIAVGEFRSWCNLNFPVPAHDISVIFHLCVIVWKLRRVMPRFRSGCSRLITIFCPAQNWSAWFPPHMRAGLNRHLRHGMSHNRREIDMSRKIACRNTFQNSIFQHFNAIVFLTKISNFAKVYFKLNDTHR